VQLRLLAQQKSTGKDLAKQVAKAKAQHEEMEAKVAAARGPVQLLAAGLAYHAMLPITFSPSPSPAGPVGASSSSMCGCAW